MSYNLSKISNSVGRNDNFSAKTRKSSILPTEFDIFDIRQHFIRILYILSKPSQNYGSINAVFSNNQPLIEVECFGTMQKKLPTADRFNVRRGLNGEH